MKKLLSVLLIVSTLFLSLGFQVCFASRNEDHYYEEYYNKYSSSQDFELNQKKAEIKKLKKLLKKAEDRNEQLEKERKKEYNKSSLWNKIKNNFSFFFSSYAGIAISVASIMAAGLISYGAVVAGCECHADKKCKVLSLDDNSFLSYFKGCLKKVNYTKVGEQFLDLSKNLVKNIHFVKVEKEKN